MDTFRYVFVAATLFAAAGSAQATTVKHHPSHPAAAHSSPVHAGKAHAKVPASHAAPVKTGAHGRVARPAGVAATRQAPPALRSTYTATPAAILRYSSKRHRVLYNPWTEPTFADSASGDRIEGEDPTVRKAAVDALGPYNGTVVVADAQTGRILSTVNQRLAATGAYQPCSTIKVVVSLAALSEQIIGPETPLQITRRGSMSMTQALAKSNNTYFAKLGEQLGFERVVRYGKLFGLGEKASYGLDIEQAGVLPTTVPDSGIGMMTSFGDGIRLTPLELAGIISSIANGGTLYYLQHPMSREEALNFVPRVKRYLDIAPLIPQIKPGMMGAVEYGTARRANVVMSAGLVGVGTNALVGNVEEADPLAGKTGTCTDTVHPGVHLGWFGSFNEVGKNKLVVVVLLTGGRGVSGPIASGIAGNVYRNLSQQNYFAQDHSFAPLTLVNMQSCCRY
jgi:penicillin-binding protein 2